MAKVSPEPNTGCWLWTGSANELGYGWFSYHGTAEKAHRVAYTLFVGPPPVGLDLDHLCATPSCVNPRHLEPVTHKENMRRGKRNITSQCSSRTVCPKGHAYTWLHRRSNGTVGRRCRECTIAQNTAYAARRRQRGGDISAA